MRIWRISDFADLSGEGGRAARGRWHSLERPIVYLAEHPALALLERLVHLEIETDDLPENYQLLEVEAPDDMAIEQVAIDVLPRDFPEWHIDLTATRRLGDAWLSAGASVLLRVPSVILPKSTNILLNPAHADAATIRIVDVIRPAYDRRLFAAATP